MGVPLYLSGAVFPGHKPEPDEATTAGQLVETTTAEQPAPVQMTPVETATAEQPAPVQMALMETATAEQPAPVQTASVNTAAVEPVQQQAEYTRTVEEIGNFFFTVCKSPAPVGHCC